MDVNTLDDPDLKHLRAAIEGKASADTGASSPAPASAPAHVH